jgi:hypothetical protein
MNELIKYINEYEAIPIELNFIIMGKEDEKDIREIEKLVHKLEYYKIVKQEDINHRKITITRKEAFDEIIFKFNSNFDEWLKNKEKLEQLIIEERVSNIKAAKSSISATRAAWVSGLLSGLTLLFSVFQNNEYKEKV